MNNIQRLMLKIPREAREKTVARGGFTNGGNNLRPPVCADGMCVWGALLVDLGQPITWANSETIDKRPIPSAVVNKLLDLGLSRTGHRGTVVALMGLNDRNKLADPEEVRRLLLPEDEPR